MPPPDHDPDRQSDSLDTRLRVDPDKVFAARAYLEEVDQTVFAAGGIQNVEDHDRLIDEAVKALFGNG